MTTRLILATLVALTPLAAAAERIAPLSPPAGFDPLTVPMPPVQQPAPVPRPQAPIVIPMPDGQAPVVVPTPRLMPAQTAPTAPATDPGDAFERGVETILENLFTEMQPSFDEMARGLDGIAGKYGPALQDLGDLMDDIRNYQTPERLPNGDILIRRRADAPPAPPVGNALRDLTTPGGSATASPPGQPPAAPGSGPAPAPPAGEPPALAQPVPAVPPASQIDL